MNNQQTIPSETLSGSLKTKKPRYQLTNLGKQMAKLPIDPKISRMLIAAQQHDCVAEMLIIASALSIQDPRERPLELREAAAKAHERFADKQSDFLAYVNIWDSFQRERDKGLTNKQLIQWCHQYFLSHLRIREWRELHKQLAEIAVEMGLVAKEHAFRQPENLSVFEKAQIDENADIAAQAKQKQIHKKNHRAQIQAKKQSTYEQIHRALLTGLVANVGMKSPEGHDYTGARGAHFHLFPTSALFKSKPKWVMAAELTETSKLYARDVAAIDPEWIEQEARHLVRYHYFEPHWERKRGEVVASERVTLYGLTVLPRRPIAYGKVAPAEARELFIRGALVAQDCDLQAVFFTHNKKLIKEIIDLENKSRKQDVLVDEEVLFDFYDKRLPENYVPSEKSSRQSLNHQPMKHVGRALMPDTPALLIEQKTSELDTSAFLAYFAKHLYDEENRHLLDKPISKNIPEYFYICAYLIDFETELSMSGLEGLLCNSTAHHFKDVHNALKIINNHQGVECIQSIIDVLAQNNTSPETFGNEQRELFELSESLRKYSQQLSDEIFPTVWADLEKYLLIQRKQTTQSGMNARPTMPSEKSAKLSGSLQSVPSPVPNGGGLGWGQNGADKTNAVAAENTTPTPSLPRQSGEGVGRGKSTRSDKNMPSENHKQEQVGRALMPDNASNQSGINARPTLPKPLADLRTFEAWLKTSDPKSLFLSKEDLMQHAAAHITEEQFPKFWQNADGKFKLSYRFEPHHPLDGVTLTVPLTVLNRINPHELEWLVQGMLREKLALLIKALPKQIRRVCVPVPDFVTQFLLSEPDQSAPILPQLAHAIAKHAGDMRLLEQINLDEWAAFRLPEHCYFNLRVVDDGGQELASSRDLIHLQQQLGQVAAVTFRDNTQEFERDNISDWTIGTLPESIKFARGKQQLTGYLALQTQKDGTVSLRLFDTALAAEQAHRKGVIKLIQMQLKDHMKDLNKGIQGYTQAAMLLKHIAPDVLKDDLTAAICDRAFIGEDELPRNEKAFKEQIKRAKSRLPAVKEAVSRYLGEITAAYTELNAKLGKHPLTPLLRERLNVLLGAGFASRTPWAQWARLPVYLRAMSLRVDKYSANPARDMAREADIQELETMWAEKVAGLQRQNLAVSGSLKDFGWDLEELRVSLFAQELKTPKPISIKRLMKEWENLGK
ncbi:DUF3418 domain-containing protein [Wielerella bovis]|uniref:DUF3418 domain-containing protein n=1 Tax=Wielerella bovis TaxID=2917790 RepID=UPI003D2A585A